MKVKIIKGVCALILLLFIAGLMGLMTQPAEAQGLACYERSEGVDDLAEVGRMGVFRGRDSDGNMFEVFLNSEDGSYTATVSFKARPLRICVFSAGSEAMLLEPGDLQPSGMPM